MLAVRQSESRIIERILRTKTGEYVLATFLVVEYQGRVRAKILSVTPVVFEQEGFRGTATQALPAPIEKAVFEIVESLEFESVGPSYFDFSFLVSQPARAPARSV